MVDSPGATEAVTAPTRGAAALLLQGSDLPRGARTQGVKSDGRVHQILAPQGCLDEATAEFRLDNTEIRASAEIYRDEVSAASCFAWFTSEMGRSYAKDSVDLAVGDVSALYVTIILARKQRVASYAVCWRTGLLIGKVTTVGRADRLDKSLVVSLARAQAARMASAWQATRA